ncbi:hypothetical protein [Alteromonas gilva]|uniref:Uncharacterized protein n=1 Tax=Alteromonas gilva TaxID=2987522 RepID=A0ABT5L0J1_9ALTE|nr:hypothetical protein [Alteromonas gilva]MDC8830398.1 hypothetical protein [Alteromonas gilva]
MFQAVANIAAIPLRLNWLHRSDEHRPVHCLSNVEALPDRKSQRSKKQKDAYVAPFDMLRRQLSQ